MFIKNKKSIKIIGYPQSSMTQEYIEVFSKEKLENFDLILPEEFILLQNKNQFQYIIAFSLDMDLRERICQLIDDLKSKGVQFKMNEPSAKIIAADVDERFIKYIDDRILKEKKNNITSRKAEYEKPPIGEKEADIVFMVDVYHHIENRKDYFSLVKKGLKPNGEMVIVDFKKGDFEHGPPNEERFKVVLVVEVATVIMMMVAAISHQCEYQPRDEHK